MVHPQERSAGAEGGRGETGRAAACSCSCSEGCGYGVEFVGAAKDESGLRGVGFEGLAVGQGEHQVTAFVFRFQRVDGAAAYLTCGGGFQHIAGVTCSDLERDMGLAFPYGGRVVDGSLVPGQGVVGGVCGLGESGESGRQ